MKEKLLFKKYPKIRIFIVFIATLPLFFLLFFYLLYEDRILPNIEFAGYKVSGKTRMEAEKYLKENVNEPEKLILITNDKKFDLLLREINFSFDFQASVDSAYQAKKNRGLIKNFINLPFSILNKKELPLIINFNNQSLEEYLSIISNQLGKEPVYPKATFEENTVFLNKGSPGEKVETLKLKKEIVKRLSTANYTPVFIPLRTIDPRLSDTEVEVLKERAEKLIGKSLTFNYEVYNLLIKEKEIFSFLKINDYQDEEIKKIIGKTSSQINRDPQNAVFRFEGEKVKEFQAAKEGVRVDTEKLEELIKLNIDKLEKSEEKNLNLTIPVKTASPLITLDEVNNLGIRELIGKGSSKFKGSIASRIHNIKLASSKFNGVLIAPEETFSFNQTLGDVSTFTGYKQAYIIKDGQTILGDGGGVCQVSTTLFRAALDAGLPITERRPHSYRVSYYEQDSAPGLDATIYSPTTDLKFKNDFSRHLLIQTIFEEKTLTLTFEIYGSKDGRISKVTKPTITDIVPPPEDQYIDDPTLPLGQIKQIDYKAWGAKVKFDYRVEKDGKTIFEKTFYSIYQPWQAKFLRGTGPVI